VENPKLYLFNEAVPLNSTDHSKLGLAEVEAPFAFARKATVLPAVASEVQSAQRDYPIVFTSLENPGLLAVTGFDNAGNLFVDESGHWESERYIPAYARCYPLAGLPQTEDGDQFVVFIDRQAEAIQVDAERAFFEGDELTPRAQEMVNFCGSYVEETRRTRLFCERMAELQLLGVREAVVNENGNNRTIAEYVCVEPEKLGELKGDVLQELFDSGYLATIFAHTFSMENWLRLDDRVRNSAVTKDER